MFFKTKKWIITFGFLSAFCSGVFAKDRSLEPESSYNPLKIISSIKDFIDKTPEENYDRSLAKDSYWGFFNDINKESFFSFLSPLMDKRSQRENWFEQSRYIAEARCFASSLVILGNGIYNKAWYTVFAGVMSVISHSIPTQFAHNLDMLGVGVIAGTVIYNYSSVINSPASLYSGLVALTLHNIDVIVSRRYGKLLGPWPHVIWHLGATFALHNFHLALSNA